MSEPPVEVSTADVRSYMNEYMTQDFISSRYYDMLDSHLRVQIPPVR